MLSGAPPRALLSSSPRMRCLLRESYAHRGQLLTMVRQQKPAFFCSLLASTCLLVGLVLSTTTPDSPHTPIGKSHQHHARPLPRVSDDLSRARTFAVGKTLPKVGCLQGHLDTLV